MQIESIVAEIDTTLEEAWDVFSYYEQTLMSRPSEPEYYEERLSSLVRRLFVQVSFTLEALQLPSLLSEFKTGFEEYRKNPVAISITHLGNPYPLALAYLQDFVVALRSSQGRHSEPIDGLQQLEGILLGTPKIIKDRDSIRRKKARSETRYTAFSYIPTPILLGTFL
jgi:hypothetical protein